MTEATTPNPELDDRPIVIERATVEDAEGIFAVKRHTWLATYPNEALGITKEAIRTRVEGLHGEKILAQIEHWRQAILADDAGGSRAIFVAKSSEGNVVGFAAPGVVDGKKRIGALYVLPETQGKGVGTALLQRAIDFHGRDEAIYLQVVRYNQNAIDFYTRFGFEITDTAAIDEGTNAAATVSIPQIEMVLKAEAVDIK